MQLTAFRNTPKLLSMVNRNLKAHPEAKERFDKANISAGLMTEYTSNGSVAACGVWSWSYGNGYMSPEMGLLDNLKSGLTPTPAEVVNDYFSVSTLFGICPFYTYLQQKEVRKLNCFMGITGDFIIDTLNYIAGNNRQFSLININGLLDEEGIEFGKGDTNFKPMSLGIKPNFESLKDLSFDEFFTLWLSRPSGWQDVIGSKQAIIQYRKTSVE